MRELLKSLYNLRVTILTWILLAGVFTILANVIAAGLGG